MTDHTIPDVTDDERMLAREWAESVESSRATWTDRVRAAARVILSDTPIPTLPALADMPGPEREACRWMQANVLNHDTCYLIAEPNGDDGSVITVSPKSGELVRFPASWVTPRPDLPRMEWPGNKKPEDATPVKVGDVIESADDPRLPNLPIGTILLDRDGHSVTKRSEAWAGTGYVPNPYEGDVFGPWKVIYIGQEDDQ